MDAFYGQYGSDDPKLPPSDSDKRSKQMFASEFMRDLANGEGVPMHTIGGMGAISDADAGDGLLVVNSTWDPKQEPEANKEKRHQGYMGQAKEAYKSFNRYINRKDWIVVPYREDDIQIWELSVEYEANGEAIYAMMASGVVCGHTADDIASNYLDNNKATRMRWDKDMRDIGDLEMVTTQGDIRLGVMYTVVKAPFPLADREFVNVQWSYSKKSEKNPHDRDWTLIARHTTHPKRPIVSDPVRATSMSGIKLEVLAPERVEDSLLNVDRVNVIIFGWVRPNGNVPPRVITLFKTNLADRIALLRKQAPFIGD